jgi:phosphatidylinositol dimannoside acyltransferase
MVRRWLNVRKFLLRRVLPVLRILPLPLASRLIAGIGRFEYHLLGGLRQGYQAAVERARATLGCHWDVPTVSLELAGNQVWWRTRDLLLDGVPKSRLEPMFVVSGRSILDEALGRGKGVILLTSHFGAHLLPPHWLAREGYPLRFYMERPRHVSKFLEKQFEADGPVGQDKLFISRKGDAAGSAGSILRASRALNAGMILYVAGDVRWSGNHTQAALFMGHRYHFSATWVNLAAITGAPVVPVFCQMQPQGNYHIEFHSAFEIPDDAARTGQSAFWVQSYLSILEDQVRRYPSNSNEFFFWPESDDLAA